jgi:hypothetical protein
MVEYTAHFIVMLPWEDVDDFETTIRLQTRYKAFTISGTCTVSVVRLL